MGRRRWFALVLCVAGWLGPGCKEAAVLAPAPQNGGAEGVAVVTPTAAQEGSFREPPVDDLGGGKLVEETWDAYSMQGTRVGFSRTTIAEVEKGGRKLVRTCSFTRTTMQRGGQTITQDMVLTSFDTPAGELVRFETRMASGGGEIASVGAVADGQLGIDTTTLGRTQSQKIPWKAEWGGIFAADRSLREKPLAPGEKRTVKGLLPIFNLPGDTHFEAVGEETIELPSGKAKVLKVNSVVEVAGQRIESVLWMDDRGQTLKSSVPSIGQEAVRTTRQDALRQPAGGQFDLLAASTVRLERALENSLTTKRVVYRAKLKSGKIDGLFRNCLSQRVKGVDEQTAELTVIAVRPDWPATVDVAQAKATDADLAANNFVQSDDREIEAMAARVAPGETDRWKLVCAVEKYVDETIRLKSFSQAFATAAEVARSLEGDCTEHAVLMAALCRNRQIPARVAFGLVYYPPEKGFAYHMWNEVWVNDRWVPMDPTLGLGGIGADHIKLGDSNLSGGSPLADLMSVIQVFGRLELAVLSAE